MAMIRGGKSVWKAVTEAERKSKTIYKCPSCSRKAVKRQASGIWTCRKCSTTFSSGAYEFRL